MSRKQLPAAASSSSPPSPPPPLPPPPSSSSSSSWYSHHCDERFFSSLRAVEDRLASEDGCGRRSPRARAFSPLQPRRRSSDESGEPSPPPSPSPSYSAPLFIDRHRDQPAQPHHVHSGGTADPLLQDSSDPPPLELLSESIVRQSPPSSPVASSFPRPLRDDAARDLEGDLERLMGLLGLKETEQGGGGGGAWSSFGGDQDSGGFLSKIAGLKGPRCRKEMERLDGWIRYYRSLRPSTGDGGGAKGKRQPARLAHLLLARAACASRCGDGSDCFDGVGFPATVEEYLQHDPPEHS